MYKFSSLPTPHKLCPHIFNFIKNMHSFDINDIIDRDVPNVSFKRLNDNYRLNVYKIKR